MFLPALLSLGCGAAASMNEAPAPATAAEVAEVKIKIDNFTYDPPTVTVKVGTKVTWTNGDDVPHTVTSTTKPRLLESRTLDTNDTFGHVFKEPGTYKYFCAVHPKMTGTVIVK
jgi:plastocyanin